MNQSLVTKLWLFTSVLACAGLLVLGVLVPQQMEGLYDFHLKYLMLSQAKALVQLYHPDPENPGDRSWEQQETVIGAQIDTLTTTELSLLASGQLCPAPVQVPPDKAGRLLAGEAIYYRTERAPRSSRLKSPGGLPNEVPEYFVAAVPLVRMGNFEGALVLSEPVTAVAKTISEFRRAFGATAIAMLTGVTLLALYFSLRLALPLRKMDEMARAMAAGDFQQRVEVTGTDEVGRLGRSINRLADTLDTTIAQLHENNARLSGILSSMSDAVILADADGQCRLLNRPAAALLQEAGLGAVGSLDRVDRSCLEALGMVVPLERVRAESASRVEKVRLNGRVYNVYLSPVPDERGGTAGVVMVWQDITQGERLEEMRRDLVANVSHELRTPIALVKGYTEALQDGLAESPAERDELLNIMHQELDRMEALVSDLLQIARMDAGQFPVEPEPLALQPQVTHLLNKLAPLIEQAGVTVRAELPSDLPLVLADADRLEQVLLNLLHNAFRYAPRGSVVTVGALTGSDRVTVFVEDQGPGIPPKERELVWERFYRCDRAHSRKQGGTGLGLAIVRGVVAAHGGQTWVEEGSDGGSRFCFTLPLAGA